MKRTIQTAEALGVPYEQWKALNEIDAVRWRGMDSLVGSDSRLIPWIAFALAHMQNLINSTNFSCAKHCSVPWGSSEVQNRQGLYSHGTRRLTVNKTLHCMQQKFVKGEIQGSIESQKVRIFLTRQWWKI